MWERRPAAMNLPQPDNRLSFPRSVWECIPTQGIAAHADAGLTIRVASRRPDL